MKKPSTRRFKQPTHRIEMVKARRRRLAAATLSLAAQIRKYPFTREEAEKFRPWIEVTQYVIDISEPKNPQLCMIVNGVGITLPGSIRLWVDRQRILFTLNGFRYSYDTPPWVAELLLQFEKDKTKVKPFRFKLGYPLVRAIQRSQPPRSGRKYNMTGKYKEQSKKRKCSTGESSRRWHGFSVKKHHSEMAKQLKNYY